MSSGTLEGAEVLLRQSSPPPPPQRTVTGQVSQQRGLRQGVGVGRASLGRKEADGGGGHTGKLTTGGVVRLFLWGCERDHPDRLTDVRNDSPGCSTRASCRNGAWVERATVPRPLTLLGTPGWCPCHTAASCLFQKLLPSLAFCRGPSPTAPPGKLPADPSPL